MLFSLATLGLASCGGSNDIAASGTSAVSAAASTSTTTPTEAKLNGQIDERTGVAPVVAQATIFPEAMPPVCYLGGPTNNWMACKNLSGRRLADIAIPGTHESATSSIANGFIDIRAATVTQDQNICEQLNDGIRYFDLRVHEQTKNNWIIFHPSDFKNGYGGPLADVLSCFKNFLSYNPEPNRESPFNIPPNKQEILILDFQALDYNDFPKTDLGYVLSLIESYIGTYMIDNSDSNYKWLGPKGIAKNIDDIWNANAAKGTSKQVIVLIQGGNMNPDPSFSTGKYNNNLYMGRENALDNSTYTGQGEVGPISEKITQALTVPGSGPYITYQTAQQAGKLNVLQVVARPTNNWYACAITQLCLPADTNNLLNYADKRINPWFEANLSAIFPNTQKAPGNKTGYQAVNNTNIVIVDHYEGLQNWVGGDWLQGGLSFIDMMVKQNYSNR